MEEFLRQNYYLLTHSIEFLAAVTGICLLKKYKKTAAIFFVYFLIYAALFDLIGRYPSHFKKLDVYYLIDGTIFEKNRWFYTIFWYIGISLFFGFYFQKIIIKKNYKSVIKYCTISFVVFSLAYISMNLDTFFIHSLPIINILGALIIFLCVILYFLETLQSDRVLTFYRSINFYISATILIWWLIITPLVFYDVYFSTADWDFVILKWQIYLFANIFMYLTFSIALIVSKPEYD